MLATTMFPIQTIGSKTNAFIGYVDDLRLGKMIHLLQQWHLIMQSGMVELY